MLWCMLFVIKSDHPLQFEVDQMQMILLRKRSRLGEFGLKVTPVMT